MGRYQLAVSLIVVAVVSCGEEALSPEQELFLDMPRFERIRHVSAQPNDVQVELYLLTVQRVHPPDAIMTKRVAATDGIIVQITNRWRDPETTLRDRIHLLRLVAYVHLNGAWEPSRDEAFAQEITDFVDGIWVPWIREDVAWLERSLYRETTSRAERSGKDLQ